MQITKRRLKEIIKEEIERANAPKENTNMINEIVSIVRTMDEKDLVQLHENLKRNK